jgi:hypothetical protein
MIGTFSLVIRGISEYNRSQSFSKTTRRTEDVTSDKLITAKFQPSQILKCWLFLTSSLGVVNRLSVTYFLVCENRTLAHLLQKRRITK